MRIPQVQVEISEMSGELLLCHTESPKPGSHGIHSLRGTENSDRTSVLGEHRGYHDYLRSLHHHGKSTYVMSHTRALRASRARARFRGFHQAAK